MGKSEEEMKASSGPMPLLFGAAFMCGLIAALAIAVVLNHYNDPAPVRGILVGAMCWVGFAATSSFATALFSQKPLPLWMIDSGFNLVSYLIAGLILGAWR
jgi:RsiW-degrading membrane proteinase PrsW (M82 family)